MQHRDVKTGDIHVIHDFKFLNIEERNAYEPKTEDLDKVCLVVEPYGFFALQSVEPTKWSPLSTVTVSVEDFETYTKEQINTLLNKKAESYNVSAEEYKCGYTRNGKEVFGLEVDCGTLPNATTKLIEIPNYNENFKYWINSAESYAKSGKEWTVPLPFTSNTGTNQYAMSIMLNFNKIRITTLYDFSFYEITKIVLNYTKE